MRRIAGLLLLGACARGAPLARVELPVVRSVAPAPVSGTMLPECVIEGAGERDDVRGDPFGVFSAHDTRAPSLIVEAPGSVAVAWSHFPTMPRADARARVELGAHGGEVRFSGWSELRGRTFTARRRMFARAGHLWARAGASLAVGAFRDGALVASVRTPFAAPETLAVRGACDAVAYEPRVTPKKERDLAADVVNENMSIDLYEAPSGRPFTTIVFDRPHGLAMQTLERKSGFSRVIARAGDVGFDAWVPDVELNDHAISYIGSGSGWGSSHCGGRFVSDRGVVTRATPLYVGRAPSLLRGASVVPKAAVIYESRAAVTVGEVVVVPFDFDDGVIAAPAGQRMWIAKDAIGPANPD